MLYLAVHHHQNYSCIKMGSDGSHFNVSLIEKDKVTKTVSINNFRRERRIEAVSNRGPPAYQPNALPLGQTGSRHRLTPSHYEMGMI